MFVYCAVRTEKLNLFQVSLLFDGLNMSLTSPCFREKVCCVLMKSSTYVRTFRSRKIARIISSMILRRKSSTQGLTFELYTWGVTSTTANLSHAAKLFKN